MNESITSPDIRLIGHDGEMIGLVTPSEGIRRASALGLDLVEISPTATPPVCKIMDFSKFKYEMQKKHTKQRKSKKL